MVGCSKKLLNHLALIISNSLGWRYLFAERSSLSFIDQGSPLKLVTLHPASARIRDGEA
jgi:hypothetical protein